MQFYVMHRMTTFPNFHLQKFSPPKTWKFLIKIQLTKSDPKKDKGWKVPSLMPNRVKYVCTYMYNLLNEKMHSYACISIMYLLGPSIVCRTLFTSILESIYSAYLQGNTYIKCKQSCNRAESKQNVLHKRFREKRTKFPCR